MFLIKNILCWNRVKPGVMIVEDERIIARDLEDTLKEFGYEVVAVVHSGEDSVKKALELKPGVVLMDIGLEHRMSGLDAAEQIYENLNTQIIYLTGYLNKEVLDRIRSISNNFEYYIRKPFESDELPGLIERAYHRYSQN